MTCAIQIAACVAMAALGMLCAGGVGIAAERQDTGKARFSLALSIALITLAILVRP